jgi:hypothetical protein
MKILITLMVELCAIPAHAEKWMEAQNKTGGKILLLASECAADYPGLRRAATTMPNGPTLWGCWRVLAGEVHIVYDDASSYTYPTNIFKFVDSDKK